ncbi:hypothetical protein [Dolosicoccus paucivorans]|uniref:Uncharacterized protein n=1 Tax=Dolosicoccus paucivorans TaxID=84521 RepID=A0A1G8N2C3_9LACT|nr:hypothetical protein [Dolosicoccus paucivorans]PMB84370.1 hypothetical protein CJ206_04325 [Dolosicoccus paucivorans]PMC58119.1 hypothetical protein CJ205_06170 [Dolosicoccus paucivorans]SDI74207.1 hypothetical protein SAMN04487994_10411 [Dolosicoccus paucivorans]
MERENVLTQLNHAQSIAFFRMLVNERFDLDKQWNEYIQLFDEYRKWIESYQLSMTILTDDQWNLIADEETMVELFKENLDRIIQEEEEVYDNLLTDWNHYLRQAEYYLQVAIDPELAYLKPNFFQRLYRVITRRKRYETPYEVKAEMLEPYEETPKDYLNDYDLLVEHIEDANMIQALANLKYQAEYIVDQLNTSEAFLKERQKDKEKIEPRAHKLYQAYKEWKKAQTTYKNRQANDQDLEYYVEEPYRDLSIYMEGLSQLEEHLTIQDFASLDKRFVHFHKDPLSDQFIEQTEKESNSGQQIRKDLVSGDYTRKELIETLKES